MDLSTKTLLAVVAMMAMNQLVMRVGALHGRPPIFWTLQAANVACGSGLLLWGLPGFESVPVIAWVLALLFFFRVIVNNQSRAQWLRKQQQARRKERLRMFDEREFDEREQN